ncbi:hypothetical protein CKAN_00786500 [Cinnamomum micranthum f. kanehirae]|uniref:Transmembrane protein n=1 Tax=Cinnamomum micranthum f. kanehirae TaxID=337451 RepID=A0A3S3Q5W6_9MAGN|nr:hypothetical protein CKAN_00786500 [Cinnamomum micranthum f. kanehirae]
MAMSISAHNLITKSRSHHFQSIHINPKSPKTPFLISFLHYPKLQPFTFLQHRSPKRKFDSFKTFQWQIRASQSGGGIDGSVRGERQLGGINLDSFLSVAEVLCIAPSVVFSIGCALNSTLLGSQKWFQVSLGNRFYVWNSVLLVGAVAIGALIRHRQWQRIYRDSSSKSGGYISFDLVERVGKLEEDLQSSVTIIRVLSRQLEKLGIRFRVTRKTLKEPVTETAALAQKNSEATRAVAVQADILEKELGEIQKVLLAMQEQQQKQLDLILAIAKSGKLRDSGRDSLTEEQTTGTQYSQQKKGQVQQMEIHADRHRGANNDKV